MAKEWQAYAQRFGILAEIANGCYSNEDLEGVARAVLSLSAECERLRAEVESWRAAAEERGRQLSTLCSEIECEEEMCAATFSIRAMRGAEPVQLAERLRRTIDEINIKLTEQTDLANDAWAARRLYFHERQVKEREAELKAECEKLRAGLRRLHAQVDQTDSGCAIGVALTRAGLAMESAAYGPDDVDALRVRSDDS